MDRADRSKAGVAAPIIGDKDKIGRASVIAPGEPAIRIRRGYVDLFWVESEGERASGTRRHVMRVGGGGIVIGMPCAEVASGRRFGPLVVAGLDCETEAVPLEQLVNERTAAGSIEGWMVGLGGAVSGLREASRRTLAHPGEVVELAKDTMICAAPRSLAWLSVSQGRLASDAVEGVGGFSANDGLLPVTETLPATALVPSTVRCIDTAGALAREGGRIGERIGRFNAVMASLLAERCVAEDAARIERRAEGSRAAEQAFLTDLSLLAKAAGSRAAIPPSAASPDADAATATPRLVAGALGLDLPPRLRTSKSAPTPLERVGEMVASANIKWRRIMLRGDWWRGDHGPLIGFRGAAQHPVALLTTPSGSYHLVDPHDGTHRIVDAALRGELSPEALCLYRALPPAPVTLGKLAGFATFGILRDRVRLFLASLAIGLLALAVPLATGFIFDTVVPNAERSLLLQLVGGLVLIALGGAMFDLVRRIALVRIEGRIEWSLQSAIVDRLLGLPASFFKGFSSGDLADRLLGIDSLRQVLTGTVVTSMVALVFSLLNFVVLFMLNAALAVVAVGLVAVAVTITVSLSIAQLRHQRGRIGRRGKLSGLVNQFIIGVNKLRMAGREQRAAGKWARDMARLTEDATAARRYEAVLQLVTETFPVLASGVIFLSLVALLPQTGAAYARLTVGGFLSFNAAFGQLLAALSTLALGMTQALVAVPLYERAKPILTAPPEARPPSNGALWLKGEIDIQRITFRYGENEPAVLEDVSLTIAPGEFVALVGASGSGKSTLLRLVLGFEKAESGTILFDGRPIENLDLAALRSEMGVVLQNGRLTPGSLFDNIVGHSGLGIEDAWYTARLVGLDADIEAMPMGMHTVVMEGAQTLSGGQRQRLMIARALVRRPRILILDEATSALDNRTQATVSESLARLNVTRLVVAHRLSTVEAADRIVVLERGRIVESGRFKDLMARDGAFAALARRQML
jgi:NHLM bacteriocin system ABC transporter ATP-binding protein